MIDYTLVLGVDGSTLPHLLKVWPTWRQYKPQLVERDLVIFYDREQLREEWSRIPVTLNKCCTLVPWPPLGVEYVRPFEGKFGNPQRIKMLSGFVHVAALHVRTPYWLKLDVDAAALPYDQPWPDLGWFVDNPAIVAPPWGSTAPPSQMDDLDKWVEDNKEKLPELASHPPLNLHPLPGAGRLRHRRICSWCSFTSASFTRKLANWSEDTVGQGRMPCGSSDGFFWYCAARLGLPIHKISQKDKGWCICSHRRLGRPEPL